MIVGAQKCGTQSHAFHLNQHPEIFTHEKELHYFDYKSGENNYEEYHKNFDSVDNQTMIGVSTPSYMYLRHAIRAIHRYNPEMKLLVFLREPVSRAYSQYMMEKTTGRTSKLFLEMIKELEHVPLQDIRRGGSWILQRGFYIDQLEYILSLFDSENLLILISEQIRNSPLCEYNKVFQFFGLPILDASSFKFNPRIHRREYQSKISKSDSKYLSEIYRPYNERLYNFLGYRIPEWEHVCPE